MSRASRERNRLKKKQEAQIKTENVEDEIVEVKVEKKEKKPLIGFGFLFMIVTVTMVTTGIYYFHAQTVNVNQTYTDIATQIYDKGYLDSRADFYNNSSASAIYWTQYEYIEKHGGSSDSQHYINNIDSSKPLNETEQKLIYAAGYTNGYTDLMIHGYGVHRDNIPK